MVWLPGGEKILKICLFILTECTNVTDTRTDRQTDRRTPHDDIGRSCIKGNLVGLNNNTKRRGKNYIFIIIVSALCNTLITSFHPIIAKKGKRIKRKLWPKLQNRECYTKPEGACCHNIHCVQKKNIYFCFLA